VLENRVLRKTFGPKRDEVTRDWNRLHTEDLHEWHSLTNYPGEQIKGNGIGGACGM